MAKALRFTLWGVAGLAAALVLLVAGFLAYRALRQHENAATYAIHTPHGVQEGGFVRIGGIDQYVLIRGEDRRNPVILMVHGGPGLAQTLLFAWFRPWEKYFTVVQWDQRGGGMTYGRYGKATPNLTPEQMVDDGLEVSEYLRQHLKTDRLILLGHSWGSDLSLQMVSRRPDLFSAYVGTGQAVDDVRAERVDYDMTLNAARKAGDAKVLKTLTQIGPPPYRDPKLIYTVRGAAGAYGPANEQPATYFGRSLPTAFYAPGYSLKDIWDASYGAIYSLESLAPRLDTFNARTLGPAFKTPMYFFQGERDTTTPTSLVQDYAREISAPHKEVVILKGDGHGALLTDPDQFLSALLAHVRPAVIAGRSPAG